MNVVEKNIGTKIDYNLRQKKLSFADGELTINLERYQSDDVVTRDIMVDSEGYLIMGKGRFYVAQVEIPAKEYEETTETVTEEVTEEVDGEMVTHEVTKEVTNRTPLPLDTDKVTLYLFSIDGINIQ